MLTSRTSRLALLTVLGALLAAASTAPAASAAATQRYATPGGSGIDCSSANPCGLREAVENASTGAEVIVAPGDYPLTATLTPVSAWTTIHGIPGQPRPRLLFSGANQDGLNLSQTSLRYVEIVQAEPWTYALWTDATKVDQTIVRGPGASCTAAFRNSTISNSVFIAPGMNVGATVCTATNGSTATGTYRNVTAIASGHGGVAMEASAVGGATGFANIKAINVIAYANGGTGLTARTNNSGASATISVSHSSYPSELKVGTNATITSGGGNQAAWPKFVNAAAGDFRQAAGSPTIDAGFDEFINGAYDVDGDPRQIGKTDIGADELFVAPDASTGAASAVTEQSATLSGSVNANGVPTAYWFEYGPTTAYGSATLSKNAGSGTSPVAAAEIVAGLSTGATYHYRLVATNSGVTTKGADRTFTTASPPPPPGPSSPPPSPSSPPPSAASTTQTSTTQVPAATSAFAGVKLVSTRLSFRGRFITVNLSCPVGTVGRCIGRTRLTVPRRARSGSVRAVTLGWAPFSMAAGRRAKVLVRVSPSGRRLLGRVRRLRGKDTNAARDGAGRSKTTVAAVTIRSARSRAR